MHALTNTRQESFAQLVAEGRDYANAYVDAGYCASTSSASQLANKPHIVTRVRELQARALKRHDVTIDELAAQLEEARQLAMAAGQPAAAVSAVMAKAKLYDLVGNTKRGDARVDTRVVRLGNRELARRLTFLLTESGRPDRIGS